MCALSLQSSLAELCMCAHEKINTFIIICRAVENYRCIYNGKPKAGIFSNKSVPDGVKSLCWSGIVHFHSNTETYRYV